MKLALCFPVESAYKLDTRLREMNFGKDEGKHYDSLSDDAKAVINSFDYEPAQGETWPSVARRFKTFAAELKEPRVYLIFTHGGLICTQTHGLGEKEILPNCSVVCLQSRAGECVGLEWVWRYDKGEIG